MQVKIVISLLVQRWTDLCCHRSLRLFALNSSFLLEKAHCEIKHLRAIILFHAGSQILNLTAAKVILLIDSSLIPKLSKGLQVLRLGNEERSFLLNTVNFYLQSMVHSRSDVDFIF